MRMLPRPVPLSDALRSVLLAEERFARYERYAFAAGGNAPEGMIRAALLLAGSDERWQILAVPRSDPTFVVIGPNDERDEVTSYHSRDGLILTTAFVAQRVDAAVALGAAAIVAGDRALSAAMGALARALRDGADDAAVGQCASDAGAALDAAINREVARHELVRWFSSVGLEHLEEAHRTDEDIELTRHLADPDFYAAGSPVREAIKRRLADSAILA